MNEQEEFARFVAIVPPMNSDQRQFAQLAWHDGYRTAKSGSGYGPWPATAFMLGLMALIGLVLILALS